MKIIFFNIREHSTTIKQIIHPYLTEQFSEVRYSSFDDLNHDHWMQENHEDINLLFYQMQDASAAIEFNKFMEKEHHLTSKIALCKNHAQGIKAINNGSDYALLLPLNNHRVLACCKFLLKGRIKKKDLLLLDSKVFFTNFYHLL